MALGGLACALSSAGWLEPLSDAQIPKAFLALLARTKSKGEPGRGVNQSFTKIAGRADFRGRPCVLTHHARDDSEA